jgi:hypothetical protein
MVLPGAADAEVEQTLAARRHLLKRGVARRPDRSQPPRGKWRRLSGSRVWAARSAARSFYWILAVGGLVSPCKGELRLRSSLRSGHVVCARRSLSLRSAKRDQREGSRRRNVASSRVDERIRLSLTLHARAFCVGRQCIYCCTRVALRTSALGVLSGDASTGRTGSLPL